MQKFGIGQPATRIEDTRLTTGQGSYIEDLSLEGQAYAIFVRSPHAHAFIKKIDTDDARSLPGVLAIYTVEDLKADNIGNVPCGKASQALTKSLLLLCIFMRLRSISKLLSALPA